MTQCFLSCPQMRVIYQLFIIFLFVEKVCVALIDGPTFAVSMTTIPPRFNSLHDTLLSWLNQELAPISVVLFIPKKYKRFKRRFVNYETETSWKSYLMDILSRDTTLTIALSSGVIQVIEIEKDYGPATKFVGMLYYQHLIYQNTNGLTILPDYWIVVDDDVRYSPITIAKYQFALQMEFGDCVGCGLTHFSEDYRLQYQLSGVDSPVERVLHIQGVDTYLIPQSILKSHYTNRMGLHFEVFIRAVNSFHQICPESFYQDDYIVSYLLHRAGIRMYSVWNNDNMASHVEGVSKSNSQMHMNPNVFKREEITKICIVENSHVN